MIVKKINTNIKGKGRHRQMIDLIDYIRFSHNKNPEEKILHAGGVNFITETHQGQKWEMITLACQSIHSNNPITHWVFSWPEDEIPTHAHVDELVQVFMREMGLEGHQVIYGLHGNTKFMHVHLAINRMNEITGKVVRPNDGFDIGLHIRLLPSLKNCRAGSRRIIPSTRWWMVRSSSKRLPRFSNLPRRL